MSKCREIVKFQINNEFINSFCIYYSSLPMKFIEIIALFIPVDYRHRIINSVDGWAMYKSVINFFHVSDWWGSICATGTRQRNNREKLFAIITKKSRYVSYYVQLTVDSLSATFTKRYGLALICRQLGIGHANRTVILSKVNHNISGQHFIRKAFVEFSKIVN